MTEVSQKVQDERLWATLAQLSGFVGLLIPFGNIVAPLLIWLFKKDQSKFVDTEAKEALNFQITITIYYVISFILMIILIGFVLVFIVMIFEIVAMIQAAIASNQGKNFRYPVTLRFIS